MGFIRTLPDEVARRIAAGEVVERPASVVKELVENALDAGAKRIWVRTAGAGDDLIEVRDDGRGMSRDDVERAPLNFATSKIQSADDLETVVTYGFRGEALASISAVSHFELTSSAAENAEAWRVRVDGKQVIESVPAAHDRGTTVSVRELFFNTPARRRFLKTALTERKRIVETILAFALVLPNVEFHFVDDGRRVLDLTATDSWRDRVAAVLGGTSMRNMVPVADSTGSMDIEGFTSLPSYTRANRLQQYLFVNRRPVREKTVVHALQDAYRNVVPFRRFPVAVIAITLSPDMVDVNVHPSKLEVRFRDERTVFSSLRRAVKSAVSARSEASMNVSASSVLGEPPRTSPSSAVEADTPRSGGASGPLRLGKTPAETQQLDAWPGANVIPFKQRIRDAATQYRERRLQKLPDPLNPSLSLGSGAADAKNRAEVDELRKKGLGDDALFWQFDDSYVFIQVRGGVVVIDQHAAHERVIFDTAKMQLQGRAPASQQILFHIHLELSLRELQVFQSSRDAFLKLGFDLEPFGGKSILVRGYPQGLKNWEEGKLLLQVFDDILHERAPGDTVTDRIVASFACRSAIKAGQHLAVDEMKMLADQLFAVQNPYSCPHGRPTIHRIPTEEIEKWFHRR